MKKKYWYAVMKDNDDNDWGYGSYDLAEAEAMVNRFKSQGYADAYIAVIDEGTAGEPTDPICIEEIR